MEIVNVLSVGSLLNWILNLLSLAYYREREKDAREKDERKWEGINKERELSLQGREKGKKDEKNEAVSCGD